MSSSEDSPPPSRLNTTIDLDTATLRSGRNLLSHPVPRRHRIRHTPKTKKKPRKKSKMVTTAGQSDPTNTPTVSTANMTLTQNQFEMLVERLSKHTPTAMAEESIPQFSGRNIGPGPDQQSFSSFMVAVNSYIAENNIVQDNVKFDTLIRFASKRQGDFAAVVTQMKTAPMWKNATWDQRLTHLASIYGDASERNAHEVVKIFNRSANVIIREREQLCEALRSYHESLDVLLKFSIDENFQVQLPSFTDGMDDEETQRILIDFAKEVARNILFKVTFGSKFTSSIFDKIFTDKKRPYHETLTETFKIVNKCELTKKCFLAENVNVKTSQLRNIPYSFRESVETYHVEEKNEGGLEDTAGDNIKETEPTPDTTETYFTQSRGNRRGRPRGGYNGTPRNHAQSTGYAPDSQRFYADSEFSTRKTNWPAEDEELKEYCRRNNLCFKCRKEGHISRHCPEKVCTSCRKFGHFYTTCPFRSSRGRYARGQRGRHSYTHTPHNQPKTYICEEDPLTVYHE